jgi:hypothetical protein
VVQPAIALDSAAVGSCRAAAIKAASIVGNIQQEDGLLTATFMLAQALIICPLPHTQQNKECPQNIHLMILF